LAVSAYGSYYRLSGEDKEASFERTRDSAVALGAPTIRVWAGNNGSTDVLPQERGEIIDDALRISEMAARAGITISLEYHAGTLADSRASVRSLLSELADPNIQFFGNPRRASRWKCAPIACAMSFRDYAMFTFFNGGRRTANFFH